MQASIDPRVEDVGRDKICEKRRQRKGYDDMVEAVRVMRCPLKEQQGARQPHEYKRGFRPGPELLRYLGIKPRAKESQRSLRGSLRLFIPDTIIINESGPPVWLYTDSQGILRNTSNFAAKQVLDRLGDPKCMEQTVVVQKTPRYGGISQYDGNESVVLNTEQLGHLLAFNTVLAAESSGDHNKRDTFPIVLQRFIKCRGHRSHVVRTVLEYAKRTQSFVITNRNKYNDDHVQDENKRLINNDRHPFGIHVDPLGQTAGQDFERLANDIRLHVEKIVSRRVLKFCIDTLKDDDGRIWFLQVHSYVLLEESKARGLPPMSLSLTARRRGGGGGGGQQQQEQHEHCYQNRCKLCYKIQPLDGLRYQITTEMVLETTHLLEKSVSPAVFERLFGRKKAGDVGLDASRFYSTHPVCATCYEICRACRKLGNASSEFAVWLKSSIDEKGKTGDGEGGGKKAHLKGKARPVAEQDDLLRQRTKSTFLTAGPVETDVVVGPPPLRRKEIDTDQVVRATENPEEFAVATLPAGCTQCRLMIAMHELYDLPDHLFTPTPAVDGAGTRPLFMAALVFQVLGRSFEIPVDLYQSTQAERNGRIFSQVSIKQVRVLSFFSENTPQAGVLPEEAGLSKLLSCEPEVTIQLCTRSLQDDVASAAAEAHSCAPPGTAMEPTNGWTMIGKCQLPLLQFRSALVRSTDITLPLGFDAKLCQIRVSVGLDRTRTWFCESGVPKTRLYKEIYVAPSHYSPLDCLPDEWVVALSATPGAGPEEPAQGLRRRRDSHICYRTIGTLLASCAESGTVDEAQATKGVGSGRDITTKVRANAVCLEVRVDVARNLVAHGQWPLALYVQYNLFGRWFTTGIAPAHVAADGARSFRFEYAHKHYFKMEDDEMKTRLRNAKDVQFVLVSPLTKQETLAVQMLSQIVDHIAKECFERCHVLGAFADWRKGRIKGLLSPVNDCDSVVLDALADHFANLWAAGEQQQQQQQQQLLGNRGSAPTLTKDELVHTGLALLRLHAFFETLPGPVDSVARARLFEEHVDLILHPSHRITSLDPEARASIQHMKVYMLDKLSAEAEELDWQWSGLIRALAGALDSLQKQRTHSLLATSLVPSLDARFGDHEALRTPFLSQPRDRVAYGALVPLEALFTSESEDTIDGVFHVQAFQEDGENASRCPWDAIIRTDTEERHDVADLMCALESLQPGQVRDQDLELMSTVIEQLYDLEVDSLTYTDLIEMESQLTAKASPSQSGKTDGPTFPSYVHASLIKYRSVYIRDTAQTTSEVVSDKVEQCQAVVRFCDRLKANKE